MLIAVDDKAAGGVGVSNYALQLRQAESAERGWTSSVGLCQVATAKVRMTGRMVMARLTMGISFGSYAEPMR
jgi:hypothetical protein